MYIRISLMNLGIGFNALKVFIDHRIAGEEMRKRGKDWRIIIAPSGIDNPTGQAAFCVATVALVGRILGGMREYIQWGAIAQHIDVVEDGLLLLETQRNLATQHLQEHMYRIPFLQLTGREHGGFTAIDAIALVTLPEIQLGLPIELGNDAKLGDIVDARVQLH